MLETHEDEYAEIGGQETFARKIAREVHDRTRIVVWLRSHGPADSRTVAADVFGGTGLPRTRSRSRTSTLLRELFADGHVQRVGEGTTGSPFVWSIT